MAFSSFLKLLTAAMLATTLGSVESTIYIRFHRTPLPFSRFSTAVFRYSVKRPDGSNACAAHACLIYCQLDGKTLRSCPTGVIKLRNLTENHEHHLLVNVTTRNGETNSSAYSWYIDTIPPTATISSDQNYTNAEKITIDITFTEACTGQGAFKCLNSSNCDVITRGPGRIHASSLLVIKPKIKYRLDVILSSKSSYGRMVISTKEGFCTDLAGNHFTRTNSSVVVIHFDRRPVLADLWTSIPSYELGINGVPRTVFAINKISEIKIFLDFSIPVMNSTQQIINALRVNSGEVVPIQHRNHVNRRFVFTLKNIAVTKIVTVELQASLIVGKTGTIVSPASSLTFLYDSTRPAVSLSTSSPSITKESNINVIVEFTNPVFGFEASMVKVDGGRLTRFKELSRALYSLTVMVVAENVVSVIVPAGKVNDISGNANLVSNRLEVKHYVTPAISVALHSFISAGVLATSLAAAILSLSSANLEAIGTLSSLQTNIIATDPSANLHGMIGHLQVFVLSDWILANQPIEYSETTKGLRWLIPRQRLPWKRNSTSIWPNNFCDVADEKLTKLSSFSLNFPSNKRYHHGIDLNFSEYSYCRLDEPHTLTKTHPKPGWLHELQIMSVGSIYGLPLNPNEYLMYFLRGEPLYASNVIKKMENYTGWEDLEMNLFWLGLGGGSLLIIHAGIVLFLRWRIKKLTQGILSVPRFELFLLILMLPCISQSSTFVIRGGTMWGIITGTFLLAIPSAFILSVLLFLMIAIFFGSFAQYKETKDVGTEEPWYTKLWFLIWGRAATGKWFYREGLPSSFLPRFGILYESRKGPTLFVFVDQNDPNTMPRWTESSQSGIGRMRAISSDDSNEEMEIPFSRRIVGCARSSYMILDLTRRVSLGIISGAYSSHHSSQSLFAFTITLIQFMCLFILRPHIRRGVHVVESISLLCETAVFGLSIGMDVSSPIKGKTQAFVMLALLIITFLSQIINEWYALLRCLLRFSYSETNSFLQGLKIAAKGIVLPFLPRKHWSRLIPGSLLPKTGLTTVLPQCPETEFERRDTRAPCFDSFSATSATVVPVLSPAGSPSIDVLQTTGSLTAERTLTGERPAEVRQAKGPKLELKSGMKKLRELARASFTGDPKAEESSTRHATKLQSFPPETSSNNPQASTSKPKSHS